RGELGIAEDAPVIGSVANFKAAKDHATLLRATAHVRRAVPGVRLLLVGQGPLEPATRHLAAELGLEETVVFAGFRSDAPRLAATLDVFTLSSTSARLALAPFPSAARRLAATFDVFTLSSSFEGLPIALLEAMALGRPAVVTRVGGVPEVVTDGAPGLLVPPRDTAGRAEGLRCLLGDPQLRARMGTAARARVLDFDIRKAVRRVEQVY